MPCTISRIGCICRMDIRELATKAISSTMAEIIKNSAVKVRHSFITCPASMTDSTMPTASPPLTTGTPTVNCFTV